MLYRTKHFYLFNIPTNSNNHLTVEKDDIKRNINNKNCEYIIVNSNPSLYIHEKLLWLYV